jgi:hypothetical protein
MESVMDSRHDLLHFMVPGLFVVLALLGIPANATESAVVSSDSIWELLEPVEPAARQHVSAEAGIDQAQSEGQSGAVRRFRVNKEALGAAMVGAPLEYTGFGLASRSDASRIELPMPDGRFMAFRFVESPIMAPELAAGFPNIKTYVGKSIDDPNISVRFDHTPAGFHAQVLSDAGAWYVEPEFEGLCIVGCWPRSRSGEYPELFLGGVRYWASGDA